LSGRQSKKETDGMFQRRILTALFTAATLLTAAAVLGPIEANASAACGAEAAANKGSVLVAGAKVADWQLSHLDNFDYVPDTAFRRQTEAPRDWIQAAFYIGLTQFADVAEQHRYHDAVLAHGEAERWGFDQRPRHADADATGAVWVWAAEHTHDAANLVPIKARFDAVLADPSTVSLDFEPAPPTGGEPYCQARWCWSDALFMAPPAWVALTKVTGDGRYLAHANAEFWATTDYLYDQQEHLYFRDSRFIARRDAAGRKIFWGRGNGWALAGLARILNDLPADHPSRPRYEALFKQMTSKIRQLQGKDGYWPVSLLQPQNTPETSGTGFFVYGLAWGINHGQLPAAQYRPSVDRGWRALVAAVQPDGKLGWVQRVGAGPDQVDKDDTQLYGVGAFLLAASEVSKLPMAEQKHCLPLRSSALR
jgi:rhamnogalacturonyl hydrolase YesR